MYAILSNILCKVFVEQPFISSTCCVKHNKGPIEHNNASNNTDKLPDTAIAP